LEELNDKIKPILIQISQLLNLADGFNHYRPANKLASKGVTETFFDNTVDSCHVDPGFLHVDPPRLLAIRVRA
jgi:hypothetical protein